MLSPSTSAPESVPCPSTSGGASSSGSALAHQPRSGVDDQIIRQVEHYFGDYNLPSDKFMQELIKRDQGWVLMTTLLTFPRLSRLSRDPSRVFAALAKSRSGLLQLEPDCGRLRRDPHLPLPDNNENRSLALQERTVFVSGFDPKDTQLDDLLQFFEGGFERVMNVRMCYKRNSAALSSRDYRAEADALVAATAVQAGNLDQEKIEPIRAEQDKRQGPGEFLGSVFVVFGTKQAAQKFLAAHVSYKGKRLYTKLQRDYLATKAEQNDQFSPAELDRTVWVHGFDDAIPQISVSRFFGKFYGVTTVRKRHFRGRSEEPWQSKGSAFVTFNTVAQAKKLLDLGEAGHLVYHGDRIRVMWQKEFFEFHGYFKKEREELASLEEVARKVEVIARMEEAMEEDDTPE